MEENKVETPEVKVEKLVNGYPESMQYYVMTTEMNDKYFNVGGDDLSQVVMGFVGMFMLPFLLIVVICETVMVPYVWGQRRWYKIKQWWTNRKKK